MTHDATPFTLEYDTRALRNLKRAPADVRAALVAVLEGIAADPFGTHPQATAMKGLRNAYRVRRGDWRAVYVVDRRHRTVRVTAAGPRGKIYER